MLWPYLQGGSAGRPCQDLPPWKLAQCFGTISLSGGPQAGLAKLPLECHFPDSLPSPYLWPLETQAQVTWGNSRIEEKPAWGHKQ